MDTSSLSLAWGRLSHRRTRSSDPSSNAPPVEFTTEGTRYTLASEVAPSPSPTPSPSLHSRSKSWSTSKEKNHTPKQSLFFQFADYQKTALASSNPLELRRTNTISRRGHKATNSISSLSTKRTSVYGSSSSMDLSRSQSPAIPQRPPRPPRGLFEDESDEEHELFTHDVLVHHAADETIQGLILQSDRAFADVSVALADAAYNTYVAQARSGLSGVRRDQSVRQQRQGLTAHVPRNSITSDMSITSSRSIRRNSLQSSHSTSTKGHTSRPSTTKKMGKRNVLLPRKLRLTLSQSVSDMLASRSAKRVSATSSLSSTYSDYIDEQPAHQRNSSITAAKRQSVLQTKRQSTDSQFALCAAEGRHLTASQMYHREMLPNSVMAWMGTDAVSTELVDDEETDDEDVSQALETKCHLARDPDLTQPQPLGPPSADNAAEARPLVEDGSPPPPPPPKNPARFGARARTSQLAPIPEMLVASAEGERRRRKNSLVRISTKSKRPVAKPRAGPSSSSSSHDSLYLVGTAYSKTSPLFRHGHIEFQHKSRHAEAEEHSGSGEHDYADLQVDWPAFHSSILCDAEDLDSGMALDEANAMADELGEWFDEFGFESHGELIKAGRAARDASRSSGSTASSRSSASSTSSASTISDVDLPMPASPDRSPFTKMQRWSFDHQAERNVCAAPGHDMHASDPIPVLSEMVLGLDIYGLPVEEEPFTKRGASGGPRMSCNLTDDLGQFLAWNPTLSNDMDEEDE
ncbi:hypothetical protein CCM_07608 [Cordyceps militaris CM01]|uniref:Uncharacterized protein n=1 Tax=Cordyceps militaris (strain CM01) TaxID=983644 RepID=G3JQA6_CORMM|nr:uncharacterized protein CCM_07608 [Cordyceps militaris CM01]EGX89357.1 hypothetical protein CCM_07608 [Cordyceps militaris CM01]